MLFIAAASSGVDELGSGRGSHAWPGTKPDAAAADVDVPLQEGRHAERAISDVALGADPEPAELDQPQRDRRDALAIELLLVEMERHRFTQRRQSLAEADQLVVFRLLLLGAKIRAVEVLLPPRSVVSVAWSSRRRSRRDADVLPCGRDRERLDARELRLVRDALSARVVVAKCALPTFPAPPHAVGLSSAGRTAKRR